MNNSVLEPLLSSPQLVEHIDALNRFAAIEAQRRREFYEKITEDDKWEFINGEIVMHSPVTHKHNSIVLRLSSLLSVWCNSRSLGPVSVEKALCAFPRNDYEPDIVFFSRTKAASIRPTTLLHPVPDFVAEVLSPSTEQRDRGVKLEDYGAHGVQEYWIIDPEAETVEQYRAQDGRFPASVEAIKEGQITSSAVAGFAVPVRSIFDDGANLEALRKLLS